MLDFLSDIKMFQTYQFLLFLIPGFLSIRILNRLVVREKSSKFEYIIEALLFSLVNYIIYSFFIKQSLVVIKTFEGEVIYSIEIKSILFLFIISVLIPIIISFFVTNDYHMKFARKLKITRSTSRSSIWFDAFLDIKSHIIVNFKNGRRLYGWPMYFCDTPENPYIFLYKPYWIIKKNDNESEFKKLEVDGVLVTPEQKIDYIEFLEVDFEEK